MATTVYIDSVLTLTKARVSSEDQTTSWNGSAMEANGDIGDFGTEGVYTPSTSASIGGSGATRYTITIDSDTPDGTYAVLWYDATPVIGAHVFVTEFEWADGAIVDAASLLSTIDTIQAGVVALSATLTEFNVPQVHLRMGQSDERTFSITFTDGDGDPVSFQGDTVSCVVSSIRGTTALREIASTVATTNYNVVQIPVQSTDNVTAGTFKYDLWNETDSQRVAYGAFVVLPSVGFST